MKFAQVFSGARFAVVGLGKAGLPAAMALREMGAEVFVWDDKAPAPAGFVMAPPWEIAGAVNALVLSPGIPHKLPKPHAASVWAAEHGVPILTDAELLYRAVRASGSKARFAGITGTNGKSTTTALLAHILAVAGVPNAAGANLGPAALALPLLPDDGVYVLEMSSYMLERLETLRFDVAAMLNLSPDHLDRHGDMAGYAAAKREIFARQDAACTAVVGVDDEPSREMLSWLKTQPAKVIGVSREDIRRNVNSTVLPGFHNNQNIYAASAMAHALGVSFDHIGKAISTFEGLPHRLQLVTERGGVRFINDSKATNADAAACAMACYEKFVWIAGGIGKEGGIESLVPFFPRVEKALLIGRDAEIFARTLAAHGVAHAVVRTLEAAVPLAFSVGCAVVLFSPAAASFDQFSNFEVRGERFAELAGELR